MIMKSIYTPRESKMRVLGFSSGTGNSLWKALELQKELEKTFEGCSYEIVGVFSDNPESKAISYAEEIGLPHYAINLKEFHASKNASITDIGVRAEFDKEVYELTKSCNADVIMLSGYVWATTEILVDNYLMINVHPADLSVERDGKRPYAGGNCIAGTLTEKEETICSSAHIVTSEVDYGPLLMRSPDIRIDYEAHEAFDDLKKKTLKEVNVQSREITARVLFDLAEGNFGYDEKKQVLYKGAVVPTGYKVDSWEEDKLRHERDMNAMIKPKAIAVIGASAKGGLGFAVVDNCRKLGYTGKLYAVNRNAEKIGEVEAFSTILDIPTEVDLAIITIPSNFVLDVAKECGEKGVKAIVCITAGFREVGGEGVENEKKLLAIVDKYNMRMLGPNCMGLLNTSSEINMNATMLQHSPVKGNVAFVTQSGAMGATLLDYAESMGLGFSFVASLGNQANVNVNDFLPILAEDESTKVIMLYLEAIVEPMRFLRLTSEVAKKKPIVLVKSGRSAAGAQAASSHTGSIAGSEEFLSAMIEKTGIHRVDTLEQAYYTAMALSKVPEMRGKRVGVITNAGGPGILLADSLSKYGFEMPVMSDNERSELAAQLLKEASTANPIDLVAAAPPEHYKIAVEAMINSGKYDAIALVCVPPASINTGLVAAAAAEPLKKANMPVVCCFMGPTLGQSAREVLNLEGIPNVDYPEKIAETMYGLYLRGIRGIEIPEGESPETEMNVGRRHQALKIIKGVKEGEYLRSDKAYELLKCYGFDIPGYALAKNEKDIEFELKFPVVAKIEHREIVHKSDVGGVILNIQGKKQLEDRIAELLAKFPGAEGVLVQEQSNMGIELIIGGKTEKGMGSAVMAGAGGIGVEIYKDVFLAHAPVSLNKAKDCIKELMCFPILEGFRGKTGINVDQFAEAVNLMSQMLVELPEISEADLNPMVYDVRNERLLALDCRIRL